MSKKGVFSANQKVYIRSTSGHDCGRAQEDRLLQISRIGSKQCTLIRIDNETYVPYSKKGYNIYLHPKEMAEDFNARNRNREWPMMWCWDWSQYLVPVGEAGWDAEGNW